MNNNTDNPEEKCGAGAGGASRVPDDEEVAAFASEHGTLPQLSGRSSQRRLFASSPFSRKVLAPLLWSRVFSSNFSRLCFALEDFPGSDLR